MSKGSRIASVLISLVVGGILLQRFVEALLRTSIGTFNAGILDLGLNGVALAGFVSLMALLLTPGNR